VFSEYGGQYLAILARFEGSLAEPPDAAAMARLRGMVGGFRGALAVKAAKWRGIVAERRARGHRVVLWGSGSKDVSFLSALDEAATVSHLVDINPHRQSRFMVGSGHPIRRTQGAAAAAARHRHRDERRLCSRNHGALGRPRPAAGSAGAVAPIVLSGRTQGMNRRLNG
jgi:nucleoside-diphosphate-sugar epimerase